MRFSILLCLLLIKTLLIGQNPNDKTPNFKWSLTNKRINNECIEFNIKTKITEGWMITTESDTSTWGLPLKIQMNKKDSVLMKRIEIIQIKGEKEYNKILEEKIGSKIETTKGDVEYLVRIYLKNKVKSIKLSGVISYWILSEEVALPPYDQKFILQF